MTAPSYESLYQHVLEMLGHLSPSLTYHNINHTIDVVNQSHVIAKNIGVTEAQPLRILKAAALFHDTGFLKVYKDHEEASCVLADNILPAYGYSPQEIAHINEVIMATKIPQSPRDVLGEILCDADLDYLGREDFFIIGRQLKAEWFWHDMIKTEEEWQQKQLRFLNFHQYFTSYSIAVRKPVKDVYLASLSVI